MGRFLNWSQIQIQFEKGESKMEGEKMKESTMHCVLEIKHTMSVQKVSGFPSCIYRLCIIPSWTESHIKNWRPDPLKLGYPNQFSFHAILYPYGKNKKKKKRGREMRSGVQGLSTMLKSED